MYDRQVSKLNLFDTVKSKKKAAFIFFVYILKCNFFQRWLPVKSSVSHDPSEINLMWFGAQETFLIINVDGSCCL